MTIVYRYLTVGAAALLLACASEPEQAGEGTTPATEVQTTQPASPSGVPATATTGAGNESAQSDRPAISPTNPQPRSPLAVDPRTTPPSPAPSAGTAPNTPNDASQDEGARVLRGASAAYEKIRSMQADFTMTMDNPLLRSKTTSRGTLSQRRPDRILLKFSEPQGDIIVGDGTYFWIYYPSTDAQQAIRTPAAQAGSRGVDLQAQFVGDPVQRFDYKVNGRESVGGRPATVMALVPKSNAGYTRLVVWVDTQDSLVRRFELTEDNGAVRRFDLTNIRVNPTLPDALFRFTPPAGVRVIDRG